MNLITFSGVSYEKEFPEGDICRAFKGFNFPLEAFAFLDTDEKK
jgi:hypothetical protein